MSVFSRFRLLSWIVAALVLVVVIGMLSPHQLGVTAYKLVLVTIAVVLGYHLDRGLFPYASPGSYLQRDWKTSHTYEGTDKPEYPIVPGCELVFAAVLLRRALVVAAIVLGVTLGL